jgi:hypothetical protein
MEKEDGGAVVPGHRDSCALVQRERRFLLAAPPPGARLTGHRQIVDRYPPPVAADYQGRLRAGR